MQPRRVFTLTALTCSVTCWLLYGLGCLAPPLELRLTPPSTPSTRPDAAAYAADAAVGVWLYEDESGANTMAARRHKSPKLAAVTTTTRRTSNVAVTTKRDNNDRVPVYRRNVTATRKLPQALIIGVKKGGTRALLEFLRLHPDVRAVGPETHFFDRHYDRGLEWYRRQMPPTLDGQLTMEKTPSYFITREVPSRIHNMSRDTKLLVVVRDPVTRAISDYAQTASKRRDMRYFEELAFLNSTTGLVDTTWGAIKIGVYAKHLDRWLQFFTLDRLHFVSGENLIKDPAGEMAKVQDFLGLRRVITENHFYFNETKGFPCLKKSEGNGSPRCLGKTKGRVHPSIDDATIQRLRDFYRPFNVKFYHMTNIDFGWP